LRKIVYGAVWLLIFAMPWENMLMLPGLGTISRLIGIFAIGTALFAILMDRAFRGLGVVTSLTGIWVLWVMGTFLWTVDPVNTEKSVITAIQLFIFVWLIWEFAREKREQRGLLQAFVLGASVSVAFTIQAFLRAEEVNYMRYAASGFDPNDLGLILALALPIALYLGLKNESKFARLNLLFIPTGLFAIVLTASRSSFAAALVGLLFLLLTSSRLNIVRKISLVVLMLFAASVLLSILPEESWSRLSTTGSELSSGNLNHRSTIWLMGLYAFAESPIIGVGAGGFRAAVVPFIGMEYAPHNLFIDVLVTMGLIGFCIFACILLYLFRSILLLPYAEKKMWISVFLIWGIGVMTLGWTMNKPTWFIFALLANQAAFFTPGIEGKKMVERPT
jgi:O-antigen ligase